MISMAMHRSQDSDSHSIEGKVTHSHSSICYKERLSENGVHTMAAYVLNPARATRMGPARIST